MSETVTKYICLNCGAPLAFDAESGSFACEFCLSKFEESDLLASDSHERAERAEREGEEYCDSMREYVCSSCGAVITADGDTAADFCVYCGSPVILSGKLSGQMRPSKVIPFAIDQQAAEERFLAFAKRHWFMPGNIFRRGKMESMKGVYFPFWVADADTRSNFLGEGTRVRSWIMGDYRYTETSYFDVFRAGDIHFEDITMSALSSEDKAMLEGILPFPPEAQIDFSMPYLSGFYAKKRDIERQELAEEFFARMRRYAETMLRDTARDFSTLTTRDVGVSVVKSDWQYCLMPVWLFSYTGRKGKRHTYAMNGYTGKIYGALPVSPWKLTAFASAIAAVAGPLAALLYHVLFL